MAESKVAANRENFVNMVIESLDKGKIPWQKDWNESSCEMCMTNPVTGTKYKGVNNFRLLVTSIIKEYEDNRWVTFKQASDNGWHIKKGEKGTPIEIFKFYDKSTKKDLDMRMYNALKPEEQSKYFSENVYVVIKNYTVFNAQQIDGMPTQELKQKIQPEYTKIDKIIENCGVPVHHQGTQAFYSAKRDVIYLPEKSAFLSESGYYATALHEIIHSTGHESRLNRDLSGKFGTKSYAMEELRAEFGSVYIGMEKGLNYNYENNIAYIQSWSEILKNDKNILFTTWKDGEKAAKMVLNYEYGKFKEKQQSKVVDKGIEI